jgi:hypothetical protein
VQEIDQSHATFRNKDQRGPCTRMTHLSREISKPVPQIIT